VAAKVTSAQVAQMAGVSQSAVSRGVTPGGSVSEKTARKVRSAAKALGYRPNVLARAVASGRSRITGLVVAYLDNYFYPQALEKLSKSLQAKGYHVLIFMTSQSANDLDNVVDEILDYQVDGIVFASVSMSSGIVESCHNAGVPVVLFNRRQDKLGVSAVTSDNFAGGRKIAEFFALAGHRRIGFISGWEGASTQRDREAGFRSGLKTCGLELVARGVGNYRTDQASEAALKMFSAPASQRPDALFVANDYMAFAVLDALRERLGLSVPNDVAVVGYDDVPPASWAAYDLTTVRQRSNLMVEHTVDTLLAEIDAPSTFEPRQIAIDGPLIVRGSTRNPSDLPEI